MAVCYQCGAPLEPNATKCKYCGESAAAQSAPQQAAPQQPQQPQQAAPQTVIYQQAPPQQPVYVAAANAYDGIDPSWPIKSKVAAGLLAIFLGGLGIHKFYMGKVGMGILYLVFCWTYIPAFVAFIEGIIYLASNDHNFQVKNRVRLK